MAELLIRKTEDWMEGLSEAEAISRGVLFLAKWDARQKPGDIIEAAEDGRWAGMNKDNPTLLRIQVPHLSLAQAKGLTKPETRLMTVTEIEAAITEMLNAEQALRIKRGKSFDTKEQQDFVAACEEELSVKQVIIKNRRYNLDTTLLPAARQASLSNTGKVSLTQSEYDTIKTDKRVTAIR